MADRPSARRVLITGLSSLWGGRIAQELEKESDVEVIIGLDSTEPTLQFERTEFVRTDPSYSILARLIEATQVNTVVHAGLTVDSTRIGSRQLHERNVIGTMNLLAAMGTDDSPVRTLVVKSSTLVYGASPRDPAWFRESSRRAARPRTPMERSLVEAEIYLHDFTLDRAASMNVAVLRCANVLGPDITAALARTLALPAVPRIAGFDPQLQLVDEEDVVRAICFALGRRLTGIFNVAGDGRLPWSEILAIAGKPPLLLPPVFTGTAAGPLARLRLVELPPELLDLLRYGRGVDNRRLKDAGFRYRYTTGGAVEHFVEDARLRRTVGSIEPAYHYDGDVESFFRHSSSVVRHG